MIFFVNADERGRIVAIASEGFHLGPDEITADFADEYVSQDETERPRYVVIYDDRTIPLFNLVNGKAVARTQAEIDADYIEPDTPKKTDYEARIKALEDQLAAYEAAYAEGVQKA